MACVCAEYRRRRQRRGRGLRHRSSSSSSSDEDGGGLGFTNSSQQNVSLAQLDDRGSTTRATERNPPRRLRRALLLLRSKEVRMKPADATKEAEEQAQKEAEDKEMSLEEFPEYEKILEDKKKALQATKVEERKVTPKCLSPCNSFLTRRLPRRKYSSSWDLTWTNTNAAKEDQKGMRQELTDNMYSLRLNLSSARQ